MNGQMSLFDLTLPMVEVNNRVRLIELFAGYGSQALAMRNLGVEFEHYRVVEFDGPAIKSYNAVHGTDFPTMDICDVHGADLGIVEKDKYTYVCTYSFPCTDISLAGLQRGLAEGSGTRSSLLWEVKRILEELNEMDALPQILLMENVTAIHSEENLPHYQRWQAFLESLGYSSYGKDLNASDFGVAQNRDRTFLVSILGEYNYNFPYTIDLDYCIEDYFEDLCEEDALRLIVKSDKAKSLLVELDEDGRLE